MKQLLAKLGVFALIVVNLGAYYVFWPDSGQHSTGADKTENPGKPAAPANTASAAPPADPWKAPAPAAPLLPPIPEPVARTPTVPVSLPGNTDTDIPLPSLPEPPKALSPKVAAAPEVPRLPTPPKAVAQADDPTKEQLKRLMETFNKKEPTPRPLVPPPLELPKQDVVTPIPTTAGNSPVVSAAHEAPRAPRTPTRPVQPANSPWTLQWEIADGRTTLTARLNKRLEFRIVGDHVKMETPDGTVVALGKVTFTGPNLKGSCDKLTIGLAADSVALEGKAQLQIQQGNLSDLAIPTVDLKGEQFTLRLTQLTGNLPVATHHPSEPVPPPAGIIPASGNQPAPSPFTLPSAFPSLRNKGS